MNQLKSYTNGQWQQGSSKPIDLKHAVTGEVIAQITNNDLNYQEAADYARVTGGHSLRKLTFHERAIRLKELALYLLKHKEEFYTLSAATGATKLDSWIDIEGGIQTLFSYSGTGRRELPNDKFIVDGAYEPLSKRGSFVGQHVQVPLEGVAIHINAFNFPCWGMLEKISVALLAGLPCIVKPASSTAFVCEQMFRRMVESNIFPEGALQLICGSVGDLLENLEYQDVVTFTGSAQTGNNIKNQVSIRDKSIRFIMETDSLNSSILGKDAVPGTGEFDLYINQIVDEIKIKCGQRCTAIRRALIPENLSQAVAAALQKKLDSLTIGDPKNKQVDMGALVNQQQRDEVREKISLLQADCEVIYGDANYCHTLDADPEIGAFMSPIILLSNNPDHSTRAHDVEAFGPVTTLIPYHTSDQLYALTKKGKGSLVASVVTNDNDFARSAMINLAPHHGRLLFLNRECATESTGHGSPLPRLVHGGPGRAGGGVEMGGVRGLNHYFQTVALQGSPDQLSAMTGQWINGSNRSPDDRHPFRKSFDELNIGNSLLSKERLVTLEDIEHFAHFTGDNFYAHMNEAAAKANPFFEDRVAHGYFIVSLAAGLFVDPDPGPVLANYGMDNLRFLQPVYAGDKLKVALTCKQKTDRLSENYGEVRWDAQITNQKNELVAQYDVLTLVENDRSK